MCNENGKWVIYKTDQYGLNNNYKDYNNSDIFILAIHILKVIALLQKIILPVN